MSWFRRLCFTIVLVALICCGYYAFNRMTDGFTAHQIKSSLPPCPQYARELTEDKRAFLEKELQQPFRYLGKGCQSYVFASEDGEIVLKFFKHKHLRPYMWLRQIPMTRKLRLLCDDKIKRRRQRVTELFESCCLAYDKMPEETGLIYLHLHRAPAMEKKVTLIDKMGFKHRIWIDDHEFIIQKRAIPFKELLSEGDQNDLAERILQLAHLTLARCQKGIADADRAFMQNVAFSPEQQRPIYIDFGRFYENPSMCERHEQMLDLERRLVGIYQWVHRYFPHLYLNLPDYHDLILNLN